MLFTFDDGGFLQGSCRITPAGMHHEEVTILHGDKWQDTSAVIHYGEKTILIPSFQRMYIRQGWSLIDYHVELGEDKKVITVSRNGINITDR